MADRLEPEFIPNPDLLLCRVHRAQYNFRENRISRAVFGKPNQPVDWLKYSTPATTVARHKKPDEIRAVAFITAGACRQLSQTVVHVPLALGDDGGPNNAHAEVRGEKTPEIQSRLRDAVTEIWNNPLFHPSA